MLPYINREVKSLFRWYRRAELRTRHVLRCKDHATVCPFALVFPAKRIPPFQFVAGMDGDSGNSNPTAWRIVDLTGAEVVDLTSQLGTLEVTTFANPDRDYIISENDTTIDALEPGTLYEMEIDTPAGTFYSETFRFVCGVTSDNVVTEDIGTTCTNWTYQGANVFVSIHATNGTLPLSPPTGSNFIVEDGWWVYTWNGASYDAVPLVDGDYWTQGPCESWYQYTSGGGGHFDVVADANVPIIIESGSACWNPEDVGLIYDIGAELSEIVDAVITVNFFFGTTMPGSLAIVVDGDTVQTITEGVNGQTLQIQVELGPSSTITFNPSADFEGCLQNFAVQTTTDGQECLHRLTWRNCGDVGTVRYKATSFRNVLYIHRDEHKGTFLGDPTPVMKLESDTDEDGADEQVFGRKDVDWTLQVSQFPWFVIDALSEIPLLKQPEITFRVAGEDDADDITDIRLDFAWEDKCLAVATMKFRADEDTTNSGCCETFDTACVESCVEAFGIFGITSETGNEGEIFLLQDGTYGVYYGLEQEEEQVDENGFGDIEECTSRFATVTDEPGYESVYYDGSDWQKAISITSLEDEGCTGNVTIVGTSWLAYGVQVQHSEDGSFWTDVEPVFSGADLAAGIEVTIPETSYFIRLALQGADCTVAESIAVPNPCLCISFDISPNSIVSGTFGAFTVDDPFVDLPSLGITVTAEYNVNGGAFSAISTPLQVCESGGLVWCWSSGIVASPGDTVIVRVRVTDQPDCEWSTEEILV